MREFFFPSHCEGSTNEDCAQLQTQDLIGILAMWWDGLHDWSSAISWEGKADWEGEKCSAPQKNGQNTWSFALERVTSS